MEEQTLGELLEALSLQPVMTMMLRLMNMVRDSACFSNQHVVNKIKNDLENSSITKLLKIFTIYHECISPSFLSIKSLHDLSKF